MLREVSFPSLGMAVTKASSQCCCRTLTTPHLQGLTELESKQCQGERHPKPGSATLLSRWLHPSWHGFCWSEPRRRVTLPHKSGCWRSGRQRQSLG